MCIKDSLVIARQKGRRAMAKTNKQQGSFPKEHPFISKQGALIYTSKVPISHIKQGPFAEESYTGMGVQGRKTFYIK